MHRPHKVTITGATENPYHKHNSQESANGIRHPLANLQHPLPRVGESSAPPNTSTSSNTLNHPTTPIAKITSPQILSSQEAPPLLPPN